MSSEESSSEGTQEPAQMSPPNHPDSPQNPPTGESPPGPDQDSEDVGDESMSSSSTPSSDDDPSYSPPPERELNPTEDESESGMVYTLKTISSHLRCIYGCRNSSVVVIPQAAREQAAMFRIFIPRGARWCESHSEESFNMEEVRISPEDLSRDNYEEYINLLFGCIRHQGHIRIPERAGENDLLLKNLTSLSFADFADLATYVSTPDPYQSLGAYMFRMRSGQPLDRIATLFGYSKETLRRKIESVMNDLNTRFKPLNLGFGHLNDEELWRHTT